MAHYTSIDRGHQVEFPDTSVALPHDIVELIYFRCGTALAPPHRTASLTRAQLVPEPLAGEGTASHSPTLITPVANISRVQIAYYFSWFVALCVTAFLID